MEGKGGLSMKRTILIAEDEADIRNILRLYLEGEGYQVVEAADGEQALAAARKHSPDLAVLDVMMPKLDGLAVTRALRQQSDIPILILSAKGQDNDKILGLNLGADDYIVKPFSLDVLGARVAAHLRREERSRRKTSARFSGELAVDYGQRCVTCRGEALPLARKEFDIVEFLSTNAGQVFDKERIYERVWGFDGQGDSSVVAEHIRRIRAKLAAAGCQNHIETVWGVGYKWKN